MVTATVLMEVELTMRLADCVVGNSVEVVGEAEGDKDPLKYKRCILTGTSKLLEVS